MLCYTMNNMKTRTIAARLDDEHFALLGALCDFERLSKTLIIERALRAYADKLKVKAPRAAKPRKGR